MKLDVQVGAYAGSESFEPSLLVEIEDDKSCSGEGHVREGEAVEDKTMAKFIAEVSNVLQEGDLIDFRP